MMVEDGRDGPSPLAHLRNLRTRPREKTARTAGAAEGLTPIRFSPSTPGAHLPHLSNLRNLWTGLTSYLVVLILAIAGLVAIGPVRHAIFDLDLTVRNLQIAHHVAANNPLVIGLRSYGEGVVYVPVALAFLIAGWIRKNRALVRRGWRLAAGLLLAGVLVWSFKLPAGRSRPRELVGPAVFNPFSGAASFPSGHTASAAVLSANLAEWVPWTPAKAGFAVIAMGTAWARIDEDKHWLSDVIAGALLGMLAWAVVRRVADGPTD